MKNLKRIFSLALAGTMLAGMLTVGASAADFTDADSIKNNEAVDTMVALNIINGKDDGSFAPEATVTRAEMAKMITIMLNGGSEPALTANAANAKFTDIGGHWAQKYIEYCVSQGVISGRGDGTFAPDATVTGTEAAKMALTALGYNETVFNFTGIDWEVNVNAAANAPSANLYEGLRTINPGEGLSRDNAAQMLYNALDANVVEISYNITSNGVETGYVISDTKTMMTEKFGAVKVEGVVTGNEIATIGTTGAEDEGETIITVTNGNEQSLFTNGTLVTVKVSTGANVLGRTVSVYVKNNSRASNAQIMGNVVLTNEDVVYTNTSGKTLAKMAEDNKVTIVSGEETGNTVTALNYGRTAAPATPVAGDTTVMIDNDGDKKIDYIFVTRYTVNQITRINTRAETITIRGISGAQDFEDVVGYEDMAEDDIVLVTAIGGKYYLTAPETVEGELEEYKQNSGKTATTKLTVEGTTYDVSNAVIATGVTLDTASELDDGALDTEAVFYLDANGKIVARGEAKENASQYAISWGGDSGSKISNQQVKLTLEDGTTGVYTLSSTTQDSLRLKNGTDGAKFEVRGATSGSYSGEHDAVGTLVTYTILSNGNVRLKLAGEADNDATFEKGKTLIGDIASTNSTVFFHVEMDGADVDKVEVYVGYKNAPTVDSATAVTVAKNAKADRVVAAMFKDPVTDGDTAKVADHLYLKSVDAVATNYSRATAVLAGSEDEVTIRLDNDDNDIYNISADVYLFTINSDDRYVLTAAEGTEEWYKEGELTHFSGDTVAIAGGEYYITDKTVEVDDTDDEDGVIEEGATVKMVIDTDTDEVLMIIITAPAAED